MQKKIKQKLFATIYFLLLFFSGQLFSAEVGNWSFDETSWGNNVFNEILDSSGNAHHGRAIGGASTTNDAVLCRAANLSASGTGDYLILDEDALNGLSQFTISLWVKKPNSGGTDFTVLSAARDNSGLGANEATLYFDDDTTFWPTVRRATFSTANQIGTSTIGGNTWRHIAWTWNGATRQSCFYREGAFQGCTTHDASNPTLIVAEDGLVLGQEQDSVTGGFDSSQAFQGLLDELVIFDSILSQAQIQTGRSNQLAGNNWNGTTRTCNAVPPSIPVADWRMDESSWNGTANEVTDSSGNNYHGVSNNVDPIAGKICNAGDFGSNSNSDYLSMNNAAMDGLDDYTVSVWVQWSGGNGTDQTILSGANSGNSNDRTMFFTSSSNFQPQFAGNIAITNLNDGNWHHLAWTRDRTRNCMFVDSVFQGCVNIGSDASVNIDSGGLILGQEQDSVGGGFSVNQDWQGLIDEMLIFNDDLSPAQILQGYNNQNAGNNWDGSARNCSGGVDHYNINHDGSGVACDGELVTITGHDASHTGGIDLDGTTINLSTSLPNPGFRGTWSLASGTGTFSDPTANDGLASYTFAAGEGSVQLYFNYPNLPAGAAQTFSFNVTDGTASEVTGSATTVLDDPNMTFAHTGFRFVNQDTGLSVIPNQVSGRDSPENLYLEAYQTNPLLAGACTGVFPNGVTVPIEMGAKCRNPATCQGIAMQVTNNATTTTINTVDNAAATSYSAINLLFSANSRAYITLNYADAGTMQLFARDEIINENGNPSGSYIMGNSNDHVWSPAGFCIEAVSAASACPTNNAACSAFTTAGSLFQTRIRAMAYETAGESNSQFCTGNSVTPNFSHAGLAISHGLIAPAGSAGSLTGTSVAMTGGDTGTINVHSISEVGVFDLAVGPTSYLGTTIPIARSASIGRFYPAAFDVNITSYAEGCNSTFTYAGRQWSSINDDGQPFLFAGLITAMNAAGIPTVTTNYEGTFAFAEVANDNPAVIRVSSPIAGDADSILNITNVPVSFVNGVDSFSYTPNVQFDVERQALDIALRITLTESAGDGVTGTAISGNNQYRLGRIRMENAFGPEYNSLDVPIFAEYFNGTQYVINPDDGCSGYDTANVTLTNSPGGLPTSITAPAAGNNAFVTGSSIDMTLSAPNSPGEAYLVLDLEPGGTDQPWLKYDWDADPSNGSEDPSATASFGEYNNSNRVIFWQEQQ